MPSLHEHFRDYEIPQLLEAMQANLPGTSNRQYLESLLSVKTADMVTKQLAGTADSIGRSAKMLADTIEHAAATEKATLENSSEYLIAALKVNTETGAKSAREISEQFTHLTQALTNASADLQSASAQSAALGRRLNWLTGVLVTAALISAAATAFYAWETKRLVELTEQQLQRAQPAPQPPRKGT
jgi:hypothetical protein